MMRELLQIAINAAIDAGEEILNIYNAPIEEAEIEFKSDNSPLTKADRAAHAIITSHLEPLGIPILSEEGRNIPYTERAEWDRLWIVDPLDGTKEFIKRNGEFTVNIALVEGGVPILGVIYVPVSGDLYFGSREDGAIRVQGGESETLPLPKDSDRFVVVASRSHLSPETEAYINRLKEEHSQVEMVSKGSSLKICLVAEGTADAYPRFAPTSEWDTAAGDAILRAAGGALLDAKSGEPLKYNKENILNPHFITR